MYRLVFLFLLAMAGVVVAQDDESDAEAKPRV